MRLPVVLSCTLVLAASAAVGQEKLAAKPPMGWNSWNHFANRVTDADVRSAADMLVSTGMRDAGYIYVNVDDTWQGKRDAQGVLHTNERFPDMKSASVDQHPFQRAEVWHLLFAGSQDLRRIRRQPGA